MTSKWKHRIIIEKYRGDESLRIEVVERDRLAQTIKELNKTSIEKHYVKSSNLINYFLKHKIIPRRDLLFITLNPDDPDEGEEE